MIGPANPTPDTITTEDIDAAFSGGGVAGMRYMALNALNYFVSKAKTVFAAATHKHGDADITAVNGAKLSDASVSRAKLDAGLEQDIADLETAWDSVSQTANGAVGDVGSYIKIGRTVIISISAVIGDGTPLQPYESWATWPLPFAASTTTESPLQIDEHAAQNLIAQAEGETMRIVWRGVAETVSGAHGVHGQLVYFTQ